MSNINFAWDTRKAAANLKKHSVSFDEAITAFYDDNAKLLEGPDHSEVEERFILLGLSAKLRYLVVCHCYRSNGNTIRIISARKTTAKERKFYRETI